MSTSKNRIKTSDPRFARFEQLHPFDQNSKKSEGTLGNKVVEVDEAGQVTRIIGEFTPTMPNGIRS